MKEPCPSIQRVRHRHVNLLFGLDVGVSVWTNFRRMSAQTAKEKHKCLNNRWRAEGKANGATGPGIHGRGHPKSEITKIKML